GYWRERGWSKWKCGRRRPRRLDGRVVGRDRRALGSGGLELRLVARERSHASFWQTQAVDHHVIAFGAGRGHCRRAQRLSERYGNLVRAGERELCSARY